VTWPPLPATKAWAIEHRAAGLVSPVRRQDPGYWRHETEVDAAVGLPRARHETDAGAGITAAGGAGGATGGEVSPRSGGSDRDCAAVPAGIHRVYRPLPLVRFAAVAAPVASTNTPAMPASVPSWAPCWRSLGHAVVANTGRCILIVTSSFSGSGGRCNDVLSMRLSAPCLAVPRDRQQRRPGRNRGGHRRRVGGGDGCRDSGEPAPAAAACTPCGSRRAPPHSHGHSRRSGGIPRHRWRRRHHQRQLFPPQRQFRASAGQAYSGVNFGLVPPNTLGPDGAQATQPGSTVFLCPCLRRRQRPARSRSRSAGSATPSAPAWTQVLYQDSNCNGVLDSGEPQMAGSLSVSAGPEAVSDRQGVYPAALPRAHRAPRR